MTDTAMPQAPLSDDQLKMIDGLVTRLDMLEATNTAIEIPDGCIAQEGLEIIAEIFSAAFILRDAYKDLRAKLAHIATTVQREGLILPNNPGQLVLPK